MAKVEANWEQLNYQRVGNLSLRAALAELAEPKQEDGEEPEPHVEPATPLDNSEPEKEIDTGIIREMLDRHHLLAGEEAIVDERLANPGAAEQALIDTLLLLGHELNAQLLPLKIRVGEEQMLCPPGMTQAQQERAVCELVSFGYRCQREIKRWVYAIVCGHPQLRLARAEREADEVFWEIGEQGARYKFRGEKQNLEQFYRAMPSKTKRDLDSCIRVFEVFYLQPALKQAKEDYEAFRQRMLRLGSVASSLLQKLPDELERFAEATRQSPEIVRELARIYDEARA